MLAKPSVLSFFPTYIWGYQFAPEDSEPINAAITRKIEGSLSPDEKSGSAHSLQSETNIDEMPEVQQIIKQMEEPAQQVLKYLGYNPSPLKVTGCWANISGPGSYHKEHSHPNNFLSAVYYVKAPEGGNTINFHDPRSVAHIIAPHGATPNAKNASTVFLEVTPGTLVIFPSWLRHSVDPNNSDESRISLAFNLMFENYVEDQSQPRFKGQFQIKND